jgi:hypothetical protein
MDQDTYSLTQPADLNFKRRKRYTDDEAMAIAMRGMNSSALERDATKAALENVWLRALSWYSGRNSSGQEPFFVDPALGMLAMEAPDEYAANHIFPLVLRAVARLSQNAGQYEVLPNTPDWTDQRAAKVAEVVLRHYHDKLDFQNTRQAIAFWGVICGSAFGYTTWDQLAGETERRYVNPFDEDVPLTDADKEWLDQYGGFDDVPRGELMWESVNPFQVSLPSHFETLERVPWLIIDTVRSVEWVFQHYPKKVDKIEKQDLASFQTSLRWQRLLALHRIGGLSFTGLNRDEDETVIVREFWRPPSPMLREGAKIVLLNRTLLENSPHPAFEWKMDVRYPLRHFRYAFVPGRFWGMGFVEHLIGPQAEYNRARTQLINHREATNATKWAAPRGAELKPVPTREGDIWEYRDGFPPTPIVPPPASQAHIATPSLAMDDMRIIASQTEVSQGQAPGNIRSGTAIRALQERDIETVGPAFQSMERLCQDLSADALRWLAKFLDKREAIRIYGEDRAIDIHYYSGADLKGNTSVRVVPRSMMPRSRAAAMETVLQLAQLQVLNPQDPDQLRFILHTMEIGELDDAFTINDQNVRRANIENEMMAEVRTDMVTGMEMPAPDVAPTDDHPTHIREHLRHANTDRWERQDPKQKMIHLAHMQMHQEALAKQQMALALLRGAGQQQGSPPKEVGKASPPKSRESTEEAA